MNYTLHQLQVFLKIAETKSVTKAANELFLTQPAVSIQLKNLQDQFDIPLTEVVGRKLYITDFGAEIAQAAENILNEVHAINYKTQAYKGTLTGKLKISVVSTGKYVIPYLLTDFIKMNPGVELQLDVANKNRVIDSLEKNEVDFCLVSVMPEHLKLERIPLMDNQLYLVANQDFKMPKTPLTPKELPQLPLIYREPGSGTRSVMELFLNKQRVNIRKKMELATNEAVKQAIIAGLGCSIMPLIGIKNELQNGDLQIIPVQGMPIQSQWNLIWLSSKRLSPAAEAYRAYVVEHHQDIINRHFGWCREW
ncbi:MAG: LysR family transcriptional regulator [Flavobacterium sp. BFFFF2]|nr:MAG: LysR family transcriptional regulator [Flavobacterium sp. BFFFF2]